MDIFAHALWTNAAARGANAVAEKKNKKLNINAGWAAFWGVFPDLFAFTIPAVYTFYRVIFGEIPISSFRDHHTPMAGFNIEHGLYQYSHSLVVWLVVFLIVWIFYKRPRYELLGSALHILIDIPSHILSFFPTPFLFPISDYRFPYGVDWSNRWYMVINYTSLVIVWSGILYKKYFRSK